MRARILPLIVAVCACGDASGRAAPDVTVSDSLGVTLRTYRHTDAHLETFELDPDPVLRIGALDGEGPDVFGRITSLKITADGGVVVSDGLAGEIRAFSAAGAHLGSLGGLGEGPGEFSASVSLLRVSGDSVWAWDQRQQRVSRFVAGAFESSWSMPGDMVLSRAVMVDSRVFGESNARLTGAPDTGMNRPRVRLVAAGEDGSWSSLFEVDGHERFLDIRQTDGQITGVDVFQPPFARGPFFGVASTEAGRTVIGGPNDRLVLREWSEGGELRAINRYPDLDRRVTAAWMERAREGIIDGYEQPTAQMTRRLTALESNVHEYLPAFDRVWSDDEGRLWLRRAAADRVEEWLILVLEDLSPIARIVLPSGFALFDVRDGLVGGQWLDALDVPHAHVYRLRTGE